MTGLLIKDWKVLKRQGRYFGMVLILACVLSFTGSRSFSSFITSYLTFMISMFAFSSFSYDELENGMVYLMALPSGRREYVKAKYTFSFLLILGGWLLGVLLRLTLFLIRFSLAEYLAEVLPSEPVYLLLCLIYVGLAFPALIRFGAEKGRNIAFLSLAVLAVGVYLAADRGGGILILGWMDRMSETSPAVLLLILAGACALVQLVSYRISVHIIEKKEF